MAAVAVAVAGPAVVPGPSPAVTALIRQCWGPVQADGSDEPFVAVLLDLFGKWP